MKTPIVACVALALSSVVTISAQERGVLLNGEPGFAAVSQDGRGFVRTSPTMPLAAKVVKGQPYSAEVVTESVQTLADGNRIVQRTTGRVYRDSEGRVRREEDRPSGGPTTSIADPVAGTAFTLDPGSRTARATPNWASFEVAQTVRAFNVQGLALAAAKLGRGGPGGGEQSEERLQDRVIEGVLATGVRRTTTISKGAIGNEQPIKIVSEEWTSPDLQVLVLTDHSDPRSGRTTYRLLKINRLDPDPNLFQVPADYTVQRMGERGGPGLRGAGAVGRGVR